MEKSLKPLTDFLRAIGVDSVSHTNKTYMGHLVALYRLLEARGCGADVCRAGMFHSIYGTERFQGFKLPFERRDEVRTLIGDRAERLAYWNCVMDRATFDAAVAQGTPPYRFRDRVTGETVAPSQEDFDDLCRVHLYDWLEQVGRAGAWDYRRAAYRGMAERLGTEAIALYDEVFAGEAAPTA